MGAAVSVDEDFATVPLCMAPQPSGGDSCLEY